MISWTKKVYTEVLWKLKCYITLKTTMSNKFPGENQFKSQESWRNSSRSEFENSRKGLFQGSEDAEYDPKNDVAKLSALKVSVSRVLISFGTNYFFSSSLFCVFSSCIHLSWIFFCIKRDDCCCFSLLTTTKCVKNLLFGCLHFLNCSKYVYIFYIVSSYYVILGESIIFKLRSLASFETWFDDKT